MPYLLVFRILIFLTTFAAFWSPVRSFALGELEYHYRNLSIASHQLADLQQIQYRLDMIYNELTRPRDDGSSRANESLDTISEKAGLEKKLIKSEHGNFMYYGFYMDKEFVPLTTVNPNGTFPELAVAIGTQRSRLEERIAARQVTLSHHATQIVQKGIKDGVVTSELATVLKQYPSAAKLIEESAPKELVTSSTQSALRNPIPKPKEVTFVEMPTDGSVTLPTISGAGLRKQARKAGFPWNLRGRKSPSGTHTDKRLRM